MAYPIKGQKPYGMTLKDYIDQQVQIALAAAQDAQAEVDTLSEYAIPRTTMDAKGDLLAATASDVVARLPVGANNTMLFADSAQATGLRWGDRFIAPVIVELAGSQLATLRRSSLAANTRRWDFVSTDTDGAFGIIPLTDTGAAAPASTGLYLSRSGTGMVHDGIRFNKGTGSPEGVVNANVGSRYVDTAATNGAVEWIKASGTGSTGWRVVYGDTGWRNIASLITNGWTVATMTIRRVNLDVEIRINGLNPSASTGSVFLNMPAGFAGWNGLQDPVFPIRLSDTLTRSVTFGGTSLVNGRQITDPAANINAKWSVTGTGSTLWPTTLPGTAA